MTTADRVRGHAFLPPAHVLARMPGLYETEDVPGPEKVVQLHYFVGASDWWIVEMSPDHQLAFGFVRLNGDDQNAEWGYISLAELRAVHVTYGGGPPIVVERDLNWKPRRFKEINL